MAISKEQLRQVISESNINNLSDVYTLFRDSFKDILQEFLEAEITLFFVDYISIFYDSYLPRIGDKSAEHNDV